ncbi:MAG: ISNCY family transposase, partial [Desulfobacterales bacterium]|nr:ISNCY family transposase [Desulfobacterales bacterium]
EDIALSGFSVFFTQSPSFLAFQISMQQNKGVNNAQSLFGIQKIPSDNHIRVMLDVVLPEAVFPVFTFIAETLKAIGYLDVLRSYNNNLLCALDATQYFSSNTIHCDNCSTKEHKNGSITYSHSALTPVFIKPGYKKVISLPPEFITPQDGHKKQDCENVAAKRWLNQFAPLYKALGITILGDDLYCRQSLCELILDHQLDFILVCKPDSHKTLYQWVDELDGLQAVETVTEKTWTGKTYRIDTYRFVNQVPLRDGENAQMVNWCELTTTLPDGAIKYKNAFATNFEISKNNVKQIVADGRARWKIENENNNILKNRGYHLAHNFGHGNRYLSQFLLTFNLLAFLFHTVLEIYNEKYKLIRDTLPTRRTFFDDIRALTRYIYFDTWDALLAFMLRGLELEFPDTS